MDSVHMTSRTLIRAAIVCGLALAASGAIEPALAQSTSSSVSPPEFEIATGGWTGGAQGDPESGRFTHCAISRQYGNGLTLALLMSPRYELNIGLLNPAWNLLPVEPEDADAEAETAEAAEEDDEEDLPPVAQVAIDGVYDREFPARPAAESILMVTTGIDDQLIELLMRGNNLDVTTDYGNYRFALSGTFNSITALRGCIDTARQLAAEARASGAAGSSAMTDRALVSILTQAGLQDVEVEPQDSATSPLGLSYAWSVGSLLTGGVHQSPRPNRQVVEIDKFTEFYVDQFESTCTETFERSEQPAEIIRSVYALKMASMQCGSAYVSLFVALDDEFYTAFFHQGAASDKAQIDEATAQIRQVIQQQAGS